MRMQSKLTLGLFSLLFVSATFACSDSDEPSNGSSSGESSSSSSGSQSSSGGSSSSSGAASSSGGSSSGASSSSGSNEESLTATVTDVVLQQEGTCELDLTLPGVDTPTDEADSKILQAIPITAPDYCEDGEEMTVSGGYTLAANEWGILSIALSESYYFEGAAHPANGIAGHNFDIATGDSLVLEAVLNAAGIEQLRAACVQKLTDPEVEYTAEDAADACALSIDGYEGEGGGNFQIEKTGLRLYLEMPHALFPIAAEGAAVTWADLGSNVISPLVQRFVSKQ